MFGMALKFLELNLEPLNILRNSDVSNRQTPQPNYDDQSTKRQSKSSQDIKAHNKAKPSQQILQIPDSFEDKENTQKEYLKNSRIKSQNFSQTNIEELKLSQQKVLQDFKKSISQSLASSQNYVQSDRNLSTSHSAKLMDKYEKVGGLVLSKIQELSEEYLEYSMRKEEFVNQNSVISGKSQTFENKSKAVSSELIKSIVKSVLLQAKEEKEEPLRNSQIQKSNAQKDLVSQNYQTHESDGRSLQMNETVTEFIKDLFYSLGLINQSQIESNSLKELTQSAKHNFSQLKGNDYIEKLHQMLQSVDNIDNQTHQIGGLSNSLKVSHLYNVQNDNKQIGSSKIFEDKPTKSRKQILIKKDEDKKVKLVSPETFSELETRRINIESEISSAVQFLTKTRRARKFAFESTEITQVYINFSMDFKFMSYKKVQNKFFSGQNLSKLIKQLCSCTKAQFSEVGEKDEEKMTMLSLAWNLVNVSKGIKTRNFIKHEEVMSGKKRGEDGLDEERCLSLLFKNRTYDFEFESREVRDEYFRSIKTMIKSSFDL